MKEERGSLGVAEVGGLIYAIGGGRGGPRSINLDTVEVFTPEQNAWSQGPKLHEQRFTTSAAAINGAIYVTGGFNGTAYLTSAERLDPRVGAWQPVGGLHLVNHSCTIRWTGIIRCTVYKSIYGAQQSHCMQIWGIRCFLIIRCTV